MNTNNSYINLEATKKLLSSRDWANIPGERFDFYSAPISLGLPLGFSFALPHRLNSNEDSLALEKALSGIADIYEISDVEISALLKAAYIDSGISSSNGVNVLSTRIISKDTANGSISLKDFDIFLGETKRLFLDTAAFAVSSAPRLEARPIQSEAFFESCRFLQTSRGSFISSFEVPEFVIQQKGFDRPEVTTSNVTDKLLDVLQLVVQDIFLRKSDIFSENFLLEKSEIISYEMLRDISHLLKKLPSDEIEFSLNNLKKVRRVRTGFVDDVKRKNLDDFVEYVRDNTTAEFDINTTGLIVELRSTDPGQDRNYVLVRRSADHRHDIALYLSSDQYKLATMAHTNTRLVKVTGAATQLRTKCRMTRIDSFEVVNSQ